MDPLVLEFWSGIGDTLHLHLGAHLSRQDAIEVTALTPDQHTGGTIGQCRKDYFTSLNNLWEDFYPTLKW